MANLQTSRASRQSPIAIAAVIAIAVCCWNAWPLAGRCAEKASEWTSIEVPGVWEESGNARFADHDGMAWYRCTVKVPQAWREQRLLLAIEKVDNAHEVFFNGTRIGGAGSFPPQFKNGLELARKYEVNAGIVRFGQVNVIAIRVYDEGGRGGFKGPAPALQSISGGIDLRGKWQFRTGDDANWAKPKSLEQIARFDRITRTAKIGSTPDSQKTRPGGLTPELSRKKFRVFEDLAWDQLLTEPRVAQPVCLDFDERGRLWVVQYRQYPHPAGLTIISRDNYWRNVYDKVPPAPPNHFRGKDRITIHEDTDGDGKYDKHKVFVDGLNMATAVQRGRGGVWVLNPPYLLFYPDKDGDDVPDGAPVVHLRGFGLEDSHSIANSLQWGPDGWLYAAQGSTVTGRIVRPGIDKKPVVSMGQLIWRYHPERKQYEIFAEGGGNAFGVEIDEKGRIFSGHNGGNTRGFHYVQGGYSRKGFSKHGALSNPYAFGYFRAMKHHNVPRFTHTFILYHGAALPARYRGQLFGVEPLQSQLVWSKFIPNGASFQTKDLGRPVQSDDKWFRPVDIKVGPDGNIYVADWYDGNVNHYRNHQGLIDPTDGRVYRLRAAQSEPAPVARNLAKTDSRGLLKLLEHPNKWYRRTALRLLGDRRDASLQGEIERSIHASSGQLALELLWALNHCGGVNEARSLKLLDHKDPFVRLWTVRFIGDRRQASSRLVRKLSALAVGEPHVEVRCQLAASARRLPAEACLAIVRPLLSHDGDAGDVFMPLMLWWAIESKCGSDRQQVLAMFAPRDIWRHKIVQSDILSRLMQRYAKAGSRRDLATCAKLLQAAHDDSSRKILMRAVDESFKGRSLQQLPTVLAEEMVKAGGASLILKMRLGDKQALGEARRIVGDANADLQRRLQCVRTFGEVPDDAVVPVLLNLAADAKAERLRIASLTALSRYRNAEIAARVIAKYNMKRSVTEREAAQSLLSSRPAWARQWLSAVDAGKIAPELITHDALRKILLHNDKRCGQLIRKHWGSVAGATTEQIQARIAALSTIVKSGSGSPYEGKKLFGTSCAKCHVLFAEGGQIGPDLTSFQRDNLPSMLLNIVNPSAEIRAGFESHVVVTQDGRILDGFLADQDERVVVLRGADGQNRVVPRDQIDHMKPLGRSLMPDRLLKNLSDQQIRDLFAYLRSTQPLNN